MIGFLKGRVLNPRLVLTTGGVGYSVNCPVPLIEGEDVELMVTTIVREDAITLYGFKTVGEQKLFEQLIKVTGVGAMLAMAILAELGVGEAVGILSRKDAKSLSKVRGVGLKKAEIICSSVRLTEDVLELAQKEEGNPLRKILEGALKGMGYKEAEVSLGIKAGLEHGGEPGEALREALTALTNGAQSE